MASNFKKLLPIIHNSVPKSTQNVLPLILASQLRLRYFTHPDDPTILRVNHGSDILEFSGIKQTNGLVQHNGLRAVSLSSRDERVTLRLDTNARPIGVFASNGVEHRFVWNDDDIQQVTVVTEINDLPELRHHIDLDNDPPVVRSLHVLDLAASDTEPILEADLSVADSSVFPASTEPIISASESARNALGHGERRDVKFNVKVTQGSRLISDATVFFVFPDGAFDPIHAKHSLSGYYASLPFGAPPPPNSPGAREACERLDQYIADLEEDIKFFDNIMVALCKVLAGVIPPGHKKVVKRTCKTIRKLVTLYIKYRTDLPSCAEVVRNNPKLIAEDSRRPKGWVQPVVWPSSLEIPNQVGEVKRWSTASADNDIRWDIELPPAPEIENVGPEQSDVTVGQPYRPYVVVRHANRLTILRLSVEVTDADGHTTIPWADEFSHGVHGFEWHWPITTARADSGGDLDDFIPRVGERHKIIASLIQGVKTRSRSLIFPGETTYTATEIDQNSVFRPRANEKYTILVTIRNGSAGSKVRVKMWGADWARQGKEPVYESRRMARSSQTFRFQHNGSGEDSDDYIRVWVNGKDLGHTIVYDV